MLTTRSQSPYHCNLLVAGYDKGVGPSLYWLDYLATLHKVNTGGTGYGKQRLGFCVSPNSYPLLLAHASALARPSVAKG